MAANWVEGANPFGLAKPPDWWLRELATFDDKLVIAPSHREPEYRVYRRCTFSRGVKPELGQVGLAPHPDTVFAAKLRAVPVTTLRHVGAQWSLQPLAELAARDIWRHGGAKRVADLLDEQDRVAKQRIQSSLDDRLSHQWRGAWANYQYRAGARASMAHRTGILSKPVSSVRQVWHESDFRTLPIPSSSTATPQAGIILASA